MSKRAEELAREIECLDGDATFKRRAAALIDAELRKERERVAERVCDIWIDQSKKFDWATVKDAILSDEED